MKVILLEDVKTQGKKGEIVEVSDAYGRNVLIAKKLGVDISNCMVFEDLLMALNTASNAGFITCAVYERTCKEEKEKLEIANFYIKDYQELIDKIN